MINEINLCKCGCNKGVFNKQKYFRNHKPKYINFCKCGCGQECKNLYINGHAMVGKKHTTETKEKISNGNKGKSKPPVSNITRGKLSETRKGKHLSEETKEKISKSKKGKTMTDEFKEKNRKAHLGIIPSESTKEKISKSNIKVYLERGDIISQKRVSSHNGHKKFPYINNNLIIKMRSTWEVKYAFYLDSVNIKWEYEPKMFKLSNGKYYFPDFLLPETNEYIEIKGYMYPKSKEKFEMFIKEYTNEKFKLIRKEDLEKLNIL